MLWACLRFPRLPLEVVRDDEGVSHLPWAVIDGPQQRRHVVLADEHARKSGVRSGQPVTAAQALCPALSTRSRDPGAERQAIDTIAAWAYRFSADVGTAGADAVVLEVGSSLTLFGGLASLLRRLRHEIAAFGFDYSLAAAPTASAACVLAAQADGIAIPRAGPLASALGAVPLSTSGLGDDAIAALRGMGFRNLRDLFRLPRAELARRIGPDALDHLDRMRGLVAETLPRYRPAERFERALEFERGIESQGALGFALQRLVRELAAFLVARDGGVERFTLVLGHGRGASTRIEVGLMAAQRDARALFELAHARLERIELAAPVHALTLVADDLPPLCPLHVDLFETRRRGALDWPALIERLRARLGEEALRGLHCVADHRPERAWRFASLNEPSFRIASPSRGLRDENRARADNGNSVTGTGGKQAGSRKPTRPFWLLERPIRLRIEPRRLLAGPERIESGWWDDDDHERDYYVIETHLGQLAWAFVPAGSSSGWLLHGWFA
ncbi:MAG TPA: DNA polymerase Y family protein [Rhodanobacteraceae bacterium]|nr:DNA polymerase Y family protein [Rhodanobacteraceae bacterium]